MHEDIVSQLIKKRNSLGLSVPKLAKVLDVPADRIYKWEQGLGSPKQPDYVKIVSWLGMEEIPREMAQEAATPYGMTAMDKLADSVFRLAKTVEMQASILMAREKTISSNLMELQGSLDAVASYQKAYHDFWCEYCPPKNVSPQEAKDKIRDKASLSVQKQKP
jgi:transcriptional regulator with XRE-family HTH domain